MSPRIGCLAIALTVLSVGISSADEGLFPFVVSYDAPDNAANVAGWLERPAGSHGFVRAEGGHLVTDAGPIRFWATNLCFEGCFPTHEQAERLAARLARFGINCVRMHHMDNYSIWGDSPNKLTIDPEKLDRLDYLIHQLKLHGIYTDINLHVSRTLGPKEGFPNVEGRPSYDKGLDNFEPRMVEAQRKYARDLLTHVNPYTKTAYADEPAVALVEINNENAMFNEWNRGALDVLPEPYATTYRKLWNAWLRQKYGTTEKLRAAWNARAVPLGQEMLAGGDFAAPLENNWSMQRDANSEVEWSVAADGPEGKKAVTVTVVRAGESSWIPQFWHAGIAVKKGHPYTLSFWARADQARRVGVNCMMAHDPWQRLGLSASADLKSEWKPFRFTFTADADDDDSRITFSELPPGTYQLSAVSLRPGGVVGLEPSQTLEADSVPVVARGASSITDQARRDFVDFVWQTERGYWSGMHRFLKDELHVKPLVSGTQVGWSPVHVQAGLDYIDAHSYWNHPSFPGRPWDPRNWYVRNVALVNDPAGTLGRLASQRVAGMAFTVSEYNHPAPNSYAAEGFPMIAAFGALQGWDGIFSFTWSHNADYEPGRITGFFDLKGDTSRLVHMPACAAMFLRGDVQPARQAVVARLPLEAEMQKLYQTLSARSLNSGEFGVDPRLSLVHRIGLDIGKAAGGPASAAPQVPEGKRDFRSDTGEIRWDASESGAGCFTVDAPRAKLLTGFTAGRTFDLGGGRLAVGPTRLGWATVSLVCLDGRGFDQPGRILVAATGWVQNTGAKLEELGNDRVTLGNRWGEAPLLCEGVPATITLPVPAERVRFYPLDRSGNRRAAAAVDSDGGNARITLGPEQRTAWYEVEVGEKGT